MIITVPGSITISDVCLDVELEVTVTHGMIVKQVCLNGTALDLTDEQMAEVQETIEELRED